MCFSRLFIFIQHLEDYIYILCFSRFHVLAIYLTRFVIECYLKSANKSVATLAEGLVTFGYIWMIHSSTMFCFAITIYNISPCVYICNECDAEVRLYPLEP